MNTIDRFHDIVSVQIDAAIASQRPALEHGAARIASALVLDRFVYAFGSGHSHLLAEEIFYRAGGLARACAILPPALMLHESASESSKREQEPGVAAGILDSYPIGSGDVLIIASNSGRNAVPVEMALAARERRIETIAITSLAHSRAFPSRHASGKRLFEVADIVLDTAGVPGDAALDLPGLPLRIGPTSTLVGAFLINALIIRAIELAAEAGQTPEIYASSNADDSGRNEALLNQYRNRIRHL
ncbi:MAG: sugar isomerase domain-containing protein [Limisphaerales bacterium]